MAKGDLAAATLVARIRTSAQSLILQFPPARPVVVVAGPTTLPASPLTGITTAPTLVPTSTTPEHPALTLPCLWLDSPLAESVRGSSGPLNTTSGFGWVDGAEALARVVWEDAQVDLTNPTAGNWFDKALTIEFRGLTWRVLKTQPMGASFRAPHSLSVWLIGADKS